MATGIEHPRDLPTPDEIHPALDAALQPSVPQEGGLDKLVFGVTALANLAFLGWGFVSTGTLADASASGLAWTMDKAGWLFVLTSSAFVVFVIWLALGKFGNIPLGRDDEEPEFRTISWVAMHHGRHRARRRLRPDGRECAGREGRPERRREGVRGVTPLGLLP